MTCPGWWPVLLLAASTTAFAEEGKSMRRVVPADAPADALVAYAMDPEGSPEELCKRQLEAARKSDPKTKNTCAPFVHKARITVATPWTDARILQLDEHSTGYVPLTQYVKLLVQVDGRWFEYQLGHMAKTADSEQTIVVRSIAVKDVIAGGQPELIVDMVETDRSGESSTKTESVLFCGFGKSGTPSCVRVVTAEDEKNSVSKHRYRLSWTFDRARRLVLRASGTWPKALSRKDYEGKRPLYFL